MFQVDEKITTKCIKKSNFIWVIEDVPILGKDSIKINGFDGMVYYQLPDYDSYKPSYKFWDFIVEEEKINVFKRQLKDN